MKITLTVILILLCLMVPGRAGLSFAQDADPLQDQKSESMDLKGYLELAYKNNPLIQAAKSEWLAEIEMYPQVKSLPDPSLLYKKPLDGTSDYELELMQMIPNPHALSLKGKRANTMAEMAQVKFEKTVRDVMVDAMKSYYELEYLYRAKAVSKTKSDLFAQMVELGRIRNSIGEIGLSELNAAESRLAQSKYEVTLLEQLIESEKSTFRKLLGVYESYPIPELSLPETLFVTLDLESIRKSAFEHSQELEMSSLSVKAGNTDLSLARSMRVPDFSLGLMYGKMTTTTPSSDGSGGMADDGMDTSTSMSEDSFTLMVGMMLPIWGGKNKAMVNEARDRRDAADAEYKNQLNMLNEQIDRLYWKILNLERLVKLYKDSLLPQARNESEIAESLFEQKQTGFSDLLESRMVTGNFETASTRAQADYLQALADLSKLTGTSVWGEKKEVQNEK